jgi:GT2 family glycosyltransferase
MPTAVVDLDVESAATHVECGARYGWAFVVVRRRGIPIAQRLVPLDRGRFRAADVLDPLRRADGDAPELLALAAAAAPQRTAPARSGTVAVCTRERPDDLARCLGAIRALDGGPHEVLVVDSGPVTSRTRDVVRAFPGVRYAVEARPGLNRARNRALREARGDIVAFTDDDAVPEPGWLSAHLAAYDDRLVQCATGLTLPAELETEAQEWHEAHSSFGRGFRRRVFDGRSHCPGASGVVGAGVNMSMRRSAVELVGLFDEALDAGTPTRSGGDNEMFARILASGWRIVYEPAAVSRHRHRRSRRELADALYGYGTGVYAAWTRSLVRDREVSVLRHAAAWFLKKQLPALVRAALRRPGAPPADLLLAELRGCAMGPFCYFLSRRSS